MLAISLTTSSSKSSCKLQIFFSCLLKDKKSVIDLNPQPAAKYGCNLPGNLQTRGGKTPERYQSKINRQRKTLRSGEK